MGLFKNGFFKLHSGSFSTWKVECEALDEEDIRTITNIICEHVEYSAVIGIPNGGLRLAEELKIRVLVPGAPALVVDDVLTTGQSMEEWKTKLLEEGAKEVIGFVIFARGELPEWIHAVWKFGGRK